ncbi:MAG: hypothetical protein FWB72_05260 [Firmicutes bacterium]|nr:hypothetical protein [Bacillota bacterium]
MAKNAKSSTAKTATTKTTKTAETVATVPVANNSGSFERGMPARDRRLYHYIQANEAFQDGNIVKANNHYKGYERAVGQQHWFMSKSDEERNALIAKKQTEGRWNEPRR